jgi:hypothetical protein
MREDPSGKRATAIVAASGSTIGPPKSVIKATVAI